MTGHTRQEYITPLTRGPSRDVATLKKGIETVLPSDELPPLIIVVMGVSGSGKTTIGTLLAGALGCAFLDADSLHSPGNIENMRGGIPLDDADRTPWLAAVHSEMVDASRRGESLVVACSALKASYRAVLGAGVHVTWVFLDAPKAVIARRLRQRVDHFMAPGLLDSQVEALEPPAGAITPDITQPPGAVVEEILASLHGG